MIGGEEMGVDLIDGEVMGLDLIGGEQMGAGFDQDTSYACRIFANKENKDLTINSFC